MTGDRVPVKILTLRLIANLSPELARGLGLGPGQGQEDLCEFKASLVYKSNSRAARAT